MPSLALPRPPLASPGPPWPSLALRLRALQPRRSPTHRRLGCLAAARQCRRRLNTLVPPSTSPPPKQPPQTETLRDELLYCRCQLAIVEQSVASSPSTSPLAAALGLALGGLGAGTVTVGGVGATPA